ncbi:thioredoxin [Corallincola luteus]|uniref:Thioredoxin n=1 Tax=Corallincola luteus TaxID=1775177 RepID=A0ABY2AHS7_9GAMM|nr:thioredoxin [Corallincola luteus]TCI02176.1 thioredoxin [Corallincola luteus]
MNQYLTEVNEEDFSELLKSEPAILVDFHAPWCGPCKAFTPVLEKLAVEYRDTVKLIKVNVDENPDLASLLRIRSMPTLVFFNHGKISGANVGLLSQGEVRQFIEQQLNAVNDAATTI